MNQIYRWLGTTRQNMHQRLNRTLKGAEEKEQLKVILFQVREDHPQMGCKALYRKVNPQTMGRDKFFEFYRSYGFRIAPKKSFKRTTDSTGVIRFPNLVTGRELTGVNQVWVSDITYYEMNGKFYYLTFIMDQYSRRIIGYSASYTLSTENTTVAALKMALGRLAGDGPVRPIIHSDGGGQYYSKEFLNLTSGCLRNSGVDGRPPNAIVPLSLRYSLLRRPLRDLWYETQLKHRSEINDLFLLNPLPRIYKRLHPR